MVTKLRIEATVNLMKLSGLIAFGADTDCRLITQERRKHMKRLIAVLALCFAVAAPSFGAEHVVTHSAKVAGKDTYKAAKYSVKETGKALKLLF